ncbi:MAG: dihydrodipicolinate synthase family protein, partial [Clostridia bacterium]|nr:dihydrodipicolinate synthase family protein [Clostridia bacterium]
MENNVLFKGVLPALISPVDDFGKVKKEAVFKLVEFDIKNGVNGFYLCGSTGEGLAMDDTEREKMLEYTLEAANGRVPVITHIGALNFKSVERLA